ncbi:hypothetical protein FDP41_000555 [Naegleria fowleri]|uniref:Uncharacterized protein n=1 Tax=Naegleria fowleri TaxID=5763 RepID=A0A6A5CA77_NAEFO|nr:uncharacterized protein FDP41_000555 [Naegleria fowleri]KAF0984656.1 hypothetical protein FDP41_000555 [Naegleria fowleri]CAG4715294.1 unnamed protein product [Naegleria fowleri]
MSNKPQTAQDKPQPSLLNTLKKLGGFSWRAIVEPAISGMCMAFGQFFVRKVVYYMHYENLSFTQTILKGWHRFLADFLPVHTSSSQPTTTFQQ